MNKIIVFFITAFSLLFYNCHAQINQENEKQVFYNIIEEDKASIDALVLYPEETRNAILEASVHPEVILNLENIQSQTREKFLQLIENLPEEEQLKIYDLTRYENLIKSLAENGKKSQQEIEKILENYPEEIHEEAIEIGRQRYKLIKNINELYESANNSFYKVLQDYPKETKEAYRELIQYPEVIEILADNMKLTVSVGDLYQKNPQWVKSRLDSMNIEAERRNEKEAAEWQKKLEDNPELLEEYTNSAEEYANEKGFSEEEYREERIEIREIRYHHYYAYPFWFGYPHWYPYSYWYRWPVWYDWGFFYGPGGSVVLTGLPSYYFTYWYFNQPSNHYYRPRLSNTFITHFKNNPRSTSGISEGVASWSIENRQRLPANLLEEDGNQIERLREYGQFESEFLESRQRRPDLTREEFLANNPRRYSKLESPGLRVSNEIARELPELQARAPQTQRPNGERTESRDKFNDIYRPREPDRKNQPEPDRRTQPSPDREEQYPDKRFQPEQDRRAQPSPDRRFRPAPERTPPRERRVEPRPRQESRPSPAPTPTPQTPSTPAPRTPSEPAPRSTPRTAPTPPSRTAPSTSPISGSNTAIEKRTPCKTISLSKEIPSYMQKIDRAIEYHNRNWRINNKN